MNDIIVLIVPTLLVVVLALSMRRILRKYRARRVTRACLKSLGTLVPRYMVADNGIIGDHDGRPFTITIAETLRGPAPAVIKWYIETGIDCPLIITKRSSSTTERPPMGWTDLDAIEKLVPPGYSAVTRNEAAASIFFRSAHIEERLKRILDLGFDGIVHTPGGVSVSRTLMSLNDVPPAPFILDVIEALAALPHEPSTGTTWFRKSIDQTPRRGEL